MGKLIHAVFVKKPCAEQPRPAKVIRLHDARIQALELYTQASSLDEDPNNYAKALVLYQRAIELDPCLALAFTNMANIYYHLGKGKKAVTAWKQAMQLDPRQPEAPYNLGYYYLYKGYRRAAVRYFLKSIKCLPKFGDAYFNLGIAYQELEKHQLAIQYFKAYLPMSSSEAYIMEAKRLIKESQKALLCPQK